MHAWRISTKAVTNALTWHTVNIVESEGLPERHPSQNPAMNILTWVILGFPSP
jgi:hypothetical protein